jgi:hypothetical protein
MRLQRLYVDETQVSDLSVIEGMPLKELRFKRGAAAEPRNQRILRAIQTLETINGLPAAEFWKRVEAGQSVQAK